MNSDFSVWKQKPIEELCCVNPACPDAGKKNAGNLRVRKGKGRGKYRILRCCTCKDEFSERAGTALWGTRMSIDKINGIAKNLKEGCGVRATSRITGASKGGVTSIGIRLGLHAKAFHDCEVRDVQVKEAQFDEKHSFVGKKTEEL